MALRLFLEYTKHYAEENSTSDFAGYVENLLGLVTPQDDE